jgi:hypothetical protein
MPPRRRCRATGLWRRSTARRRSTPPRPAPPPTHARPPPPPEGRSAYGPQCSGPPAPAGATGWRAPTWPLACRLSPPAAPALAPGPPPPPAPAPATVLAAILTVSAGRLAVSACVYVPRKHCPTRPMHTRHRGGAPQPAAAPPARGRPRRAPWLCVPVRPRRSPPAGTSSPQSAHSAVAVASRPIVLAYVSDSPVSSVRVDRHASYLGAAGQGRGMIPQQWRFVAAHALRYECLPCPRQRGRRIERLGTRKRRMGLGSARAVQPPQSHPHPRLGRLCPQRQGTRTLSMRCRELAAPRRQERPQKRALRQRRPPCPPRTPVRPRAAPIGRRARAPGELQCPPPAPPRNARPHAR